MKLRNIILLIGDLAVMYMALILALIVRHGLSSALIDVPSHIRPFSLLFLAWLVVLYINDFYSRRRLRVDSRFIRSVLNATLVNLGIAVAFFYLIGPTVGITPKTNLFLVMAFFIGLFMFWRRVVSDLMISDRHRQSVLFLEPDQLGETLIRQMFADPAVPFRAEGVVSISGDIFNFPAGLKVYSGLSEAARLVSNLGIEIVVVGGSSFGDLHRHFYQITLNGATIIDSATFWEDLNREIPVFVIDTAWLVKNFGDMHKREFEVVKRTRDFVCAFVLGLLLSGVAILVAIAVRFSSRGPIFYRQIRVGKDGRRFTLIKFRTMREDAEKDGPRWSIKGDQRVTAVGRVLRYTHLDELPQVWNILKGDMSFVGPRPERPEFVGQLEEHIPYYSLRHLVRPGVSGWAQINYPYGASVEDAAKKLAYDLFYIKRRGHLLDLKIALKTLAMLFRGEGR
jgi:exopolysaccharide biosynthesis polyprenyl glycosylphosphotransferase